MFLIAIFSLVSFHVHGARHNGQLRFGSSAQEKPSQVDTPVMTWDAPPKSPPHRPEISSNDPHEVVDYAAMKAASRWKAQFGGLPEGSPGDFHGSTCKEVCTACYIAAVDYPSCKCKASCVMGSDPTICPKKFHGWLGKRVTTPDSQWKAVCNAGTSACNSCVDGAVHEEIDQCRKERVPALCFHRLKMRYATSEASTKYCTHGGLADCDRFLYAAPEQEGWTCFDDYAQCKGSKVGKSVADEQEEALNEARQIDNSHYSRETPCVWCGIPIQK